jgi:Tol biopolymer transport system component
MSVLKRVLALSLVAGVVAGAALAASRDYGSWEQAVRVESIPGTDPSFNGMALDGCPFISRDGKTFYMASNRPGGLGGIDIWVSKRASVDDPWGAPANVGAPVNSGANDFCPTISRDGHLFYFVSNRAGGCGGDDIYTTRLRPDGWDPVENLGCEVNSSANEASPFPIPERAEGPVLYFSSTRSGGGDLFRSASHGGVFGTAEALAGVNSPTANDGQPNLRRDGLEIFFFSTRPGGLGMQDLYSASRSSVKEPWSTPVNLGPLVNSAAPDTRPSLSWDGTTLYFGSGRPGGEGDSDHYVTTRSGD